MLDVFESFLKENFSADDNTVASVFRAFDQDNDQVLNREEFELFIQQLFQKTAHIYNLTAQQVEDVRYLLDLTQSSTITLPIFGLLWSHCVKSILSPKSALLVLDVQNDHASLLSTEVKLTLFSNLNDLTERQFDLFVLGLDSYPNDHASFVENLQFHHHKLVQYAQPSVDHLTVGESVTFQDKQRGQFKLTLNRKHCVAGTKGAEVVNHLNIPKDTLRVCKGTSAMHSVRSAFRDEARDEDTGLIAMLRKREITDLYIAGLGLSSGVRQTALDAVTHGFRTVVIWDACCEVAHLPPDSPSRSLAPLLSSGVAAVMTDEVEQMLNCSNRRPELGYVSAVNYAMALKKLSRMIPITSQENENEGGASLEDESET